MPDISQWLSAATPPESDARVARTPEGCQRTGVDEQEFWHPSRMLFPDRNLSRGVAALDHRLIAEAPAGGRNNAEPDLGA